jgi:hypothetical protein
VNESPNREAPPERLPPGPQPLHPPGPTEELLQILRRIERQLADWPARQAASVPPRRRRELPLARLVGALLQALVVGLIVAALSDWAFEAPPGNLLIKLAFASVLQLGVLTAFVSARETH